MSDKKLFIRASVTYSIVQVLALAASLISFPVLTRVLSISEYGALGLCNTVLLFGSAFAKLGLANSIVRFFAHYRQQAKLEQFLSTMWIGGVGAAVVVSFVLVPLALLVAPESQVQSLVAVILVVCATAVFGIFSNFLRAEERNDANSVATLVLRYLGTFGGIGLVYWAGTGVSGIFYAQFAVLAVLTIWYYIEYSKRFCLRFDYFSWNIFREAISFGAPLIIYELSSIALAFSDRFLISRYCGMEQLGIYTAGYTISFYIADIVRQPLQLAVAPIYMRIYAEKGVSASVLFIEEAIGYVALVIMPIFAGCTAIKGELIVLLASVKYAGASEVIPWVLGGSLLFGCQSLLAASFSILKQTRSVALLSLVAAFINIILNITLLKTYGIIAAAWATAISYMFMICLMTIVSYKSVKIRLPMVKVSIYCLSASIMYISITNISMTSLILRIFAGALIYCGCVLALDRKLFHELRTYACRPRKVEGTV